MDQNAVYRAIFRPKTKKGLDKEAKKLVGKEIMVVPLSIMGRDGFRPQWAFISNTNDFIFLEDELEILEEIFATDTETSPDKGEGEIPKED